MFKSLEDNNFKNRISRSTATDLPQTGVVAKPRAAVLLRTERSASKSKSKNSVMRREFLKTIGSATVSTDLAIDVKILNDSYGTLDIPSAVVTSIHSERELRCFAHWVDRIVSLDGARKVDFLILPTITGEGISTCCYVELQDGRGFVIMAGGSIRGIGEHPFSHLG